MISGSASRRYARAILGIGQAQDNLESLTAEVEQLAQSIETSADLRTVLLNPAFSQSQPRVQNPNWPLVMLPPVPGTRHSPNWHSLSLAQPSPKALPWGLTSS